MKAKIIIFGAVTVIVIVFLIVMNQKEKNSNLDENVIINNSNFENVGENIRCKQNNDCLWAVNLSKCCPIAFVTNLETMEKYNYLAEYGKTYEYYDSLNIPKVEKNCVGCTLLQIQTHELKCINNKCT